jgi:hypothetical protein
MLAELAVGPQVHTVLVRVIISSQMSILIRWVLLAIPNLHMSVSIILIIILGAAADSCREN